ncbi:MAG: efflux transporter outer membrane subunit [Pseudomonadota bacterium]
MNEPQGRSARRILLALCFGAVLSGCTVGPDFVPPEPATPPAWIEPPAEGLDARPADLVAWWRVFDDPVLDELVETAVRSNNTLEIAALRVLEARAQLGIATGSVYPQVQIAAGDATYLSPPDNSGLTSGDWSYSLGATAAWEIDFWGRFRRGIESADAAFLASIAAYDQARVLLTGAVVGAYATVRSLEEQLRIAEENVKIQQRSFDIAQVLFENGADSELDMQQAKTLLLSTQATIPGLEIALAQARNALSTLLGEAPGALRPLLAQNAGIPAIPDDIAIGLPADMLRRRPDVRQAELQAQAANALVGLAEADLYPSFSLTGSIGLAAGAGDSDFGDLFDSDALTWSIGPSFVWPFLNYGRIRNNVRVQDARLQQSLIAYRETVLQAAREAEDAMASFIGTRKQREILEQTVDSAMRSNDLSTLRYAEGFSDYERVLNAQQALFNQQQRFVTNQGDAVRALVSLYTALGGGWEGRDGLPWVDPDTLEVMGDRTNWGSLLEGVEVTPVASGSNVTTDQ